MTARHARIADEVYARHEPHRHRCLVRQVLRYLAAGDRRSVEAMKRGPAYRRIRDDVNAQWAAGNRGIGEDWR